MQKKIWILKEYYLLIHFNWMHNLNIKIFFFNQPH